MTIDIDWLLKSKTRTKVLLFFAENEGCIDTPRGVSTWTGEPIQSVRPALEGLVKKGYLKAHRTSSTVGYSCTVSKKELHSLTSSLSE